MAKCSRCRVSPLRKNPVDVKAAGFVPCLVRGQPGAGGAAQDALLGQADGVRRAAVALAAAGFYFNKNNSVAVKADHIQLKPRLPPVAGKQGAAQPGCSSAAVSPTSLPIAGGG